MPGPTRKLSAVQAADILQAYEAGASLYSLARQYNVSTMTISRTITRQGGNTRVTGRPSIWTAEQLQQMREEYEKGATLRYLALVYGGHHTNIGDAILRAGGALRGHRTGKKPKGLIGWLNS